jgi:hypothetical protein
MSLKAYLDESGTEAGARVTVCAGWVARKDDWQQFCGEWQCGLREHGAPYLHMRELSEDGTKDRRSAFYGWGRQKVDRFINHMIPIARQPPKFGVVAAVELDAYKDVIHPALQAEYKIPYCFVFQIFYDLMLRILIDRKVMRKFYINEPVMFFHADNNFSDFVYEAYQHLKAVKNRSWRIEGIAFLPWFKHEGFQAADLLANRYNKILKRELRGEANVTAGGWNYELTRDGTIIVAYLDRVHLKMGMERIRRQNPGVFDGN